MNKEYTVQAKNALKIAERAAKNAKRSYIGTEHLLLGLLEEGTGTAALVLKENKVEREKMLQLIRDLIAPEQQKNPLQGKLQYTPRLRYLLHCAGIEAANLDSDKIGTEHLLIVLLKDDECSATRLLVTMGVTIQKLYANILSAIGENGNLSREELNAKLSENYDDLATPVLDQYGRDLTELAGRGKMDPVIGRDKEINRVIQILSRRTKNNPCLMGEPGVGKTAIAEGLAQRIATGLVPESIRNKRIVMLDMAGMVAGTKYRGEFEERISNLIKEVASRKNILLFIDEIHTIIGAGGAEGSLDAANIMKPALSRGEIQLIGATTINEYRKYIEKDPALERRFQPVVVEEPTQEEALDILKGLRPFYERHHNVQITDEALEAAVKLSVRYITDRYLPDKAIDLIDEAASAVKLGGFKMPSGLEDSRVRMKDIRERKELALKAGDIAEAKQLQEEQRELQKQMDAAKSRFEKRSRDGKYAVTEETVAETVSGWTRIPVEKLAQSESKRLANLEKILHKRVIGQEEAVTAVAKAIRRSRVGLKDPKRPIGSFLFLGPTGVGKTELSKALAEAVFGTEQAMIRVDMSEYMEKFSVSRLIGSPPGYVGYEEGGQLSEKVRLNPYSVILFDEIEKAHPDVFNILLQVLDDGHITDSQGRKVDFKQTCIIMTSNAGAQAIVEPKRLGFKTSENAEQDHEYMKNQVMEVVRRMFRPEFLNRIDDTIVFHSLTKEEMKEIVVLLLSDLEKRCREQMQITLRVSGAAKEELIRHSFNSRYGARPLRREIQSRIEDTLSEKILSGEVGKGDTVIVGCKAGKITMTVRKP
ncbi:MAG: ATP-dependent Clp protease ATP-binding subunit [Lachnospiraceae bacterium]|nr:ATP-dependent Clp protease ATP-binding subunit [Lachnospiraceae bacterium]